MLPSVESLNFHHLRYFWSTVREGGVLPASRRLRVSHPTVSAQLKELEAWLGVALFDRRGRALELTDAGKSAFEYADRIFGLGRDLLEALASGEVRPQLRIGVTDGLPKLFVRQLLEPLVAAPSRPRLVVEEERQSTLLARLAVRDLDVVLSDAPAPVAVRLDGTDHELGRSGVSILAEPTLARRLRHGFPGSLAGAPWLAPNAESQLGQILAGWFRHEGLRPEVVAEVADSALLKTLGSTGAGAFAVPRVAEAATLDSYPVEVVGRRPELRVGFHATTAGHQAPEGLVAVLIARGRTLLRET